jgi:uncharacterized protein YjiS (DUF1127 family)
MTTRCDACNMESTFGLRSNRRQGFLTGLVFKLQDYAEYRRQRRALMALDDHMLKDIGLSRAEAARIVDKDFDWTDK